MVARQQAANGTCKVVFHQSCEGRHPEACKDNRWTHSLTEWGTGNRLVVAKDIRHHCCAKGLQKCTGSDQTLHTGKLGGEPEASGVLLNGVVGLIVA